ncbi:MAG: Clp protease N-terminal domain-containing protein, partial [Pirellulales bacterium]
MSVQLSDSARRAMAHAETIARQWNHQYVGTEHLLLGLADTDNGVLARLLGEHQVDAAQLRA